MIITHITCQFSVQNLTKAIALLEQVRDKMRTNTDCLNYQISQQCDLPECIFISQSWQNIAAFDEYRNSSDFAGMIGDVKPMMTQPPKVDVYDAHIHG